jgi:tetratricopeptide (TPR) repeat protein
MQLRHRRDLRREKVAEASRLLRMAYALQVEGEIERALALYEKSIRLHASAEAETYLAWALSTVGRLDDAASHCVAAMRLDPGFPNPWNDLGAYRVQQGRPEDALFFLKRAVRLDSPLVASHAHYNLHRAYLELGDRGRALAHLHAALETDPDFRPARAALGDLLRPGSVEEADDLGAAMPGSPVLVPAPLDAASAQPS